MRHPSNKSFRFTKSCFCLFEDADDMIEDDIQRPKRPLDRRRRTNSSSADESPPPPVQNSRNRRESLSSDDEAYPDSSAIRLYSGAMSRCRGGSKRSQVLSRPRKVATKVDLRRAVDADGDDLQSFRFVLKSRKIILILRSHDSDEVRLQLTSWQSTG